jgi:hypothetical protein
MTKRLLRPVSGRAHKRVRRRAAWRQVNLASKTWQTHSTTVAIAKGKLVLRKSKTANANRPCKWLSTTTGLHDEK